MSCFRVLRSLALLYDLDTFYTIYVKCEVTVIYLFSILSQVSELESENEVLKEQVETLTFHVGAYRRALEKCPEGLEKYREGFREFRDHILCSQCEKDRLLMKIKELEDRIQELDGVKGMNFVGYVSIT